MARNRQDERIFSRIASDYGLDVADVSRIVHSFFSIVRTYASRLPFDNPRRIYTKDRFDELASAWNIPYLGRLGPVYSRYLKWRKNESMDLDQATRSSFRTRWTQGEIEDIAASILSGETPSLPEKKKKSELYDTVWMVGKDGKKLAKQVIKKD